MLDKKAEGILFPAMSGTSVSFYYQTSQRVASFTNDEAPNNEYFARIFLKAGMALQTKSHYGTTYSLTRIYCPGYNMEAVFLQWIKV